MVSIRSFARNDEDSIHDRSTEVEQPNDGRFDALGTVAAVAPSTFSDEPKFGFVSKNWQWQSSSTGFGISTRYTNTDGEQDNTEIEKLEDNGLPTSFHGGFTSGRKKKTFFCDLCQTELNSEETKESHKKGKF